MAEFESTYVGRSNQNKNSINELLWRKCRYKCCLLTWLKCVVKRVKAIWFFWLTRVNFTRCTDFVRANSDLFNFYFTSYVCTSIHRAPVDISILRSFAIKFCAMCQMQCAKKMQHTSEQKLETSKLDVKYWWNGPLEKTSKNKNKNILHQMSV